MNNLSIDYVHIEIPSFMDLRKEAAFKLIEGKDPFSILGIKHPAAVARQYQLQLSNHLTVIYTEVEKPVENRNVYIVFSLANMRILDLEDEESMEFEYIDIIYPYGEQDPIIIGSAIEWMS